MPTTNNKTPIKNKKPVERKSVHGEININLGGRGRSQDEPRNNSNRVEFARDEFMLDDTALITDILVTQKTLVKRYGNALCEGSSQKFRSIINNHLGEIAEDQYDSFLYMQEHNMYPTEPAPEAKLCEAKQKFKSTEQELKR